MKKLLFVISLFFIFSKSAFSSSEPATSNIFIGATSIPAVPASALSVARIQSTRFDRSKVKRIYLAPGLGSIVLFPCALTEVFVGRAEDVKVQISPNDKKTLFLNLKLNSSLRTNLIAKCEMDKIFVFDLIPSKSKHQDVVEIRNYFGRPNSNDTQLNATSKPSKAKSRLILKSPILMKKGGSQ